MEIMEIEVNTFNQELLSKRNTQSQRLSEDFIDHCKYFCVIYVTFYDNTKWK